MAREVVGKRGADWGLAGHRFRLDPRRTALLIVDMQQGMARRDRGIIGAAARVRVDSGAYFFERLEGTVIPALRRLLGYFRANGLRIIHVHYASLEPDGSDLPAPMRERNAERMRSVGALSVYPVGHPDARAIEEVEPAPGERLLVKTSASAFTSTSIDQLLRNWDIEGLVVGGVLTSGCVDLTARDAADRGYRVVLLEDGCATWKEASHLATLEVFRNMFGRVAPADEVIAELGPGPDGSARARGAAAGQRRAGS